jgi:hypothetical protein
MPDTAAPPAPPLFQMLTRCQPDCDFPSGRCPCYASEADVTPYDLMFGPLRDQADLPDLEPPY